MLSNEMKILLIVGSILLSVLCSVMLILLVVYLFVIDKRKRNKKKETYQGKTYGKIMRIVDRGLEFPWVIYVQYEVNGKIYEFKETAKVKSTAIKIGKIPVGQQKTFVLGNIKEGDLLEIRYDLQHPEKAIIYENDGNMT